MKITILRNFDGFVEHVEIIEIVERQARPHNVREYDFKRGVRYWRRIWNKHRITYKGKAFITFPITGLGSCINIKELSLKRLIYNVRDS